MSCQKKDDDATNWKMDSEFSETDEFHFQEELNALKSSALAMPSHESIQQPPQNTELNEKVAAPVWLDDVLGRSEFTVSDFQDCFLLVQVLSVICPDAVDLSWYMPDGALNCPDLTGTLR